MKASLDVEDDDDDDGDGGEGLGPPVVVDVAAVPSGLVLTTTAFVITARERRDCRRGAGECSREREEQAAEQRELVEAMRAEVAAAAAAAARRICCGLAALVAVIEAAAAAGDEAAADARMIPVRKKGRERSERAREPEKWGVS